MEVKGFVKGCRSCEDFAKAMGVEDLKPVKDQDGKFVRGTIVIDGEKYEWVVVESRAKAAKKHYVFTVYSHHVGVEEQEVRALLNAETTRVAFKLVGKNYRVDNNSGTAATLDHYHTQIISPTEGEPLVRVVANVAKVIREDFPANFPAAATGTMVKFLEDSLLQKAK